MIGWAPTGFYPLPGRVYVAGDLEIYRAGALHTRFKLDGANNQIVLEGSASRLDAGQIVAAYSGSAFVGNSGAASIARAVIASQVAAITAAANQIPRNPNVVRLNPNANYTLTSLPTIPDGSPGEILFVTNQHASFVVTVQDNGTLAGSGLRLGAATRAIGPRDWLMLVFSADSGDWEELNYTAVL